MKIAIGTDHRGRDLKNEIIDKLKSEYDFIDSSLVNYDTDDYPDFAFATSKKVVSGEAEIGVLICGTGIGMSIAANKVKGIRCALVSDGDTARLAREHNDANVVAFSSSLGCDKICKLIRIFASSHQTEEKHKNRVNKIINYENGEYNEL